MTCTIMFCLRSFVFVVWTFRINHQLGGLEVTGYHAVNIALHAIVSMQFFLLSSYFLPSMHACGVAGLLFATHPVHVEAVASLAGRAELLSGFFFLSSLWLYLTQGSDGSALIKCTLSIVCAGLGMLCKETVSHTTSQTFIRYSYMRNMVFTTV